MVEYNYESYKGRYERAKSKQNLWLDLLYDAYDYTMPNRNSWDVRYAPGRKKGAKVYDTTAVKAVKVFTSKLQASLTPPKQKWMKLVSGQVSDFAQQSEINRSLEEATNIVFDKIHGSNFDLAINESYYDLAIGTAALLVNELPGDKVPFYFEVVPIFFFYPEQGPFGRIQTVFRDICEIPYNIIPQQWPDATLTRNQQEALNTRPNETTTLIEGVVYDPDKDVYHQVLWSEEEEHLMLDVETPSSPWIVYRWSKTPTENLGRGPVLDAMPSIKSLNVIGENDLITIGFASNPAYFGFSDGLFNPYTARIRPGTIVPINQSSANKPPLMPIPNTSNMRDVQISIEDYRNQINQLLYANPLGDPNGPVRTATEITLRAQREAEEIGPAFGRLEVELIQPLITRILYILRKKGLIPKFDIDIDIEYEAPIAQSQKLQEVLAFQQMAQMLEGIIGPELTMQAFNISMIPETLAEGLNVPLKLIKTPADINAQLEAAAQMLQQQQNVQAPQPATQQAFQQGPTQQILQSEGV